MFFKTLSGRLLGLTIIFVMLAEVTIFVPSIARFRLEFLESRLERAQIAALSLLAAADYMVDDALESELLKTAGVLNVVLKRNAVRELVLSSPMPSEIERTYDLQHVDPLTSVRDAFVDLFGEPDAVIRVVGVPVEKAGELIEITMPRRPLQEAMIEYAFRILLLATFISLVTSILLYFALQRFVVAPIRRVIDNMKGYAAAPEDARLIINPSSSIMELREAEEALRSLQLELIAAFRQKARLAALGEAVAKIAHDLRNILTTAQLLADRLAESSDPAVRRIVPKLVGALQRAIALAEKTLSYGKAEEKAPELGAVALGDLVADVIESERLAAGAEAEGIEFQADIPADATLLADAEQLFRILFNLVHNAREAISAHGGEGRITISARETGDGWQIIVEDTGPGLPKRALENLFRPFAGGAKRGGTGLGLAIAHELVRGHGGRLELEETGPNGTRFVIFLPSKRADEPARASSDDNRPSPSGDQEPMTEAEPKIRHHERKSPS